MRMQSMDGAGMHCLAEYSGNATRQGDSAQTDKNLKVTTGRYRQGLSTSTDVLKAEDNNLPIASCDPG